jgi:RHS repeat-associated protein
VAVGAINHEGIWDYSDSIFTIKPSPKITVTSPNGGETLTGGSEYTITWTSSNVVGKVKISYSTDDGVNYNIIWDSTDNDGEFIWHVPEGVSSNTCRVAVGAINHEGIWDYSDTVFFIAESNESIGISGKITDSNGSPISGVIITLFSENGQTLSTTPTDLNGMYQFNGIAPGYYEVRVPENAGYYPLHENGTSFRFVEIVDSEIGISEVNFTKDEFSPFVKLLFPRTGDKLKGDFGVFGTAFKGECSTCKEINRVEILLNENEKYYGNFYGSTSGRFSLSQIVWKDIANDQTIPQTWEEILTGTSGYVPLQVRARNQDGVWGYSEKVNIAKADTAATVTISHHDFQVPFPAGGASKTLGYQVSGATVSSASWYVFRRVTLPCDLQNAQNVEFDARTTGETISECYPLDDVYPVCVAVMDEAGNTLVDIENIMVYTAARKGHPVRNNSGSTLAAFGANVVSGNFYHETTDMTLEGVGLPFRLWRRYGSLGHDENSWMGSGGWGHAYDIKLFLGKSGRRLYLSMPDGHWERYAYIDGVWQTMTPGAFGVIVENSQNRTFTLHDKQMTRYEFAHIGGNWWRPKTIIDKNGNTMAFSYTPASSEYPWTVVLSSITDTRGRIITFAYGDYEEIKDGQTVSRKFLKTVYDGTTASTGTDRKVSYDYTLFDDGKYRLTSFTDRRGKIWQYVYEDVHNNGAWLLTQIKDPRGVTEGYAVLTNNYDEQARIIRQTDALGNTWEIAYTSDTLTTIKNPLGEETRYVIDAQTKMVVAVENAASEKTSLAYKAEVAANAIQEMSLMHTMLSPRHQGTTKATTYKYSAFGTGNTKQIIDPTGRETTLSWLENRVGENRNLPEIITPPGISDAYNLDYDNNGNMTFLHNPLGKTTVFTYNPKGQNLSITDARNHKTVSTYTNGYLTRTTDPLGNFIEYVYDIRGRVRSIKDKRGNTTILDYDANDNITRITDPDGKYFENTYDDSGNKVSIKDKRGNTVIYAYNAANRVESVQESVGGEVYTTIYEYDGLQRVKRILSARGKPYKTAFDVAGRVQKRINPLLEFAEYTYDTNGNVEKIEFKTAGGATVKTISNTYDDLDRLTEKRVLMDAETFVTAYGYNLMGKVSSVTNPKGKITRFEYDNLGRLDKVIDANGKNTLAAYDAVDNLIRVVDPKGNETRFEYDELNRMTKRIDHENNTWEYAYDENSNLDAVTDPQNRTTSYTYDKLNRRTKETFDDNSFVQYTYDPNGNPLTMTDALGTTRYVYDEINRLKSRTDCFGKTVSYSFDEDSNITDISYPGNKTVQYAFDDAGRMTSVTDWLNRSTTYGYNTLGRIVSTLYGNGSRTDIGYDSAGRLTSFTDKKSDGSVIASYAYTLDPNGNRLSATVTEPMAPKFSSSEYNFQYNTLNQLTSGLNSGFTFDANGNLIQEVADGKTITYGYDDNDRLVSLSDGTENYQYTYSGTKDLMEVEKSGEKTRYVLDVNQNLPAVVARTDGSGEILDYFVYGAAGLVSKITPAGQAFTYHFDPTGSTVAMSDSSENLVNTYAYTPYGRTTRQESIDNPFEYIGQFGVMAEDNGLNYMRARFYHPGIRRFISQDTVWGEVSSPQSLNLYAYVEGNPVMRVDPSGLTANSQLQGIAGAIGSIINILEKTDNVKLGSMSHFVSALTNEDLWSQGSDIMSDFDSIKNLSSSQMIDQITYEFLDSINNLTNLNRTKVMRSLGVGVSAGVDLAKKLGKHVANEITFGLLSYEGNARDLHPRGGILGITSLADSLKINERIESRKPRKKVRRSKIGTYNRTESQKLNPLGSLLELLPNKN